MSNKIYFSPEETECQCGCGLDITDEFRDKLSRARKHSVVPFIITSGARCEMHNRTVGGVVGSSHTKSIAVDIRYRNNFEKFIVIQRLIVEGFNRLGVKISGKSNGQDYGFIHVDDDQKKATNTMWSY